MIIQLSGRLQMYKLGQKAGFSVRIIHKKVNRPYEDSIYSINRRLPIPLIGPYEPALTTSAFAYFRHKHGKIDR